MYVKDSQALLRETGGCSWQVLSQLSRVINVVVLVSRGVGGHQRHTEVLEGLNGYSWQCWGACSAKNCIWGLVHARQAPLIPELPTWLLWVRSDCFLCFSLVSQINLPQNTSLRPQRNVILPTTRANKNRQSLLKVIARARAAFLNIIHEYYVYMSSVVYLVCLRALCICAYTHVFCVTDTKYHRSIGGSVEVWPAREQAVPSAQIAFPLFSCWLPLKQHPWNCRSS